MHMDANYHATKFRSKKELDCGLSMAWLTRSRSVTAPYSSSGIAHDSNLLLQGQMAGSSVEEQILPHTPFGPFYTYDGL